MVHGSLVEEIDDTLIYRSSVGSILLLECSARQASCRCAADCAQLRRRLLDVDSEQDGTLTVDPAATSRGAKQLSLYPEPTIH